MRNPTLLLQRLGERFNLNHTYFTSRELNCGLIDLCSIAIEELQPRGHPTGGLGQLVGGYQQSRG
jgi:hypothetical protein